MVGQTLGHYEILDKIGSGGMGDVYLAEDAKLDRRVALKVLPSELAESDERRARFEREAKALAALNHPNIVTVHSVEEAGGVHFITMELVKGKTLAEILPKRGFPLQRFYALATPLVDAVAAAHEHGIVHRDLKPGNVMVTDDGVVKVLDFGLARNEPALRSEVDSESPTELMTREGVLAGTLPYMAPEQAEGQSADHRADLFALGVVLYEMLTGARPFDGDTPAATLSSILKDEPRPITGVPRPLARLVQRCLNKDLRLRLQNARDLRNELVELRESPIETTPASSSRVGHVAIVAAAIGGVALGYALWGTRDDASPPSMPRLANPMQVTFDEGLEDVPDWSPDGKTLAYHSNVSGNFDIWIKQLGSGEALNRTADHPGVDQFPSWSPDGSQIAFWSDRDDGGFFIMSALTGRPRKVASADRLGKAQWSLDGQRLGYIALDDTTASFEVVSLLTGDVEKTTLARQSAVAGATSVRWHPGEELVAYLASGGWTSTRHPLKTRRLGDREAFFITDGTTEVWSPEWSADGRYLYYVSDRDGALDLWRRPISPSGSPTGPPVPLTTGLGIRSVAISGDGVKIAYSQGRRVANVWRVPILEDRPARWSDAEQITFDRSRIEMVDVSDDGSFLLFDSNRSGNEDLWVLSLESGELRQVTRHPEADWDPNLSPDGTEIAFYSFRDDMRNVWVVPFADGSPVQLTTDGGWWPSWTPDGQSIVYGTVGAIHSIPKQGGEPDLVHRPNIVSPRPEVSPDGEILLFRDETGLWQIPFDGGDRHIVSEGPVLDAYHWGPDGRYVYYVGSLGKSNSIWRVSLEDGSERPMTDLTGRRGSMGPTALATDGEYLYFTWEDDLGDIWVMDLVTEETE